LLRRVTQIPYEAAVVGYSGHEALGRKGTTMELTLTEFMTLDGVTQGPGAPDEDTSDGFTQGGWFVPHMDERFIQLAATWLGEADALMFGRRTYDNFSRDWPNITDPDDPFTDKMNGQPKYVASHSLKIADWNPTTIISGEMPVQVAEVKRQPGREIQIRVAEAVVRHGCVGSSDICHAEPTTDISTGRRNSPLDSSVKGKLNGKQS
jgi:dihydrofolate reductase